MINIPDTLRKIMNLLISAGFDCYLVGGCVRNSLMGIEPGDYDLTTTATPDEMSVILKNYKLYTVGKKHGTVAVILDNKKIEITTMRKDGTYSDNRHPDKVEFTSDLKIDLARRDFTVNAIACSVDGEITDCFGGQEDIENKTLRAVGEANDRFCEDALRIMRALRFVSEYDFSIESETRRALFDCRELLKEIAAERIADELCRLLCGKYAGNIIKEYCDIISVFIPELKAADGFVQKSKYHKFDVLTHICCSIDNIEPQKTLRLAMLFHDIGKPFSYTEQDGQRHFKGHAEVSVMIAERIMHKLRFDNETMVLALFLVKYHDYPITKEQLNKKSIKRMLKKFGERHFFLLCKIKKADDLAKADFVHDRIYVYDEAINIANEIIKAEECYMLKDLEVNGHDVTARGYKGAVVGRILDALLCEVIEGNLENEKIILLKFIDNNKNLW